MKKYKLIKECPDSPVLGTIDDKPKVSIREIEDLALVESFKVAKKLTKFKPFEELSETDRIKFVKLRIESDAYGTLLKLLKKL